MPDTPARSYTAGFAGKRLARENGRAVPHRQRRRDSAGLRPWLNPNPIIDRRPDTLPRSQVLLGRLNRDMTEQKLDLIQLTARTPAQPSAGSSQGSDPCIQFVPGRTNLALPVHMTSSILHTKADRF